MLNNVHPTFKNPKIKISGQISRFNFAKGKKFRQISKNFSESPNIIEKSYEPFWMDFGSKN